MKVVRNAGRDSQVFELQEDNGIVVGKFSSRAEAEAAIGKEVPVEAEAVVEEVVEEVEEGEV